MLSGSGSSVTEWIEQLRQGNESAVQKLWARYRKRLELLGKQFIEVNRTALYDEEDIASTAFEALCANLRNPRGPELASREDLWRLLALLTIRKSSDLAKIENAKKRGGDRTRSDDEAVELDKLPTAQPSPDLAHLMTDQCRILLDELKDPELEAVALLKLEGFNNLEIAAKLNYNRRTIQRMLNLIKEAWSEHVPGFRIDEDSNP